MRDLYTLTETLMENNSNSDDDPVSSQEGQETDDDAINDEEEREYDETDDSDMEVAEGDERLTAEEILAKKRTDRLRRLRGRGSSSTSRQTPPPPPYTRNGGDDNVNDRGRGRGRGIGRGLGQGDSNIDYNEILKNLGYTAPLHAQRNINGPSGKSAHVQKSYIVRQVPSVESTAIFGGAREEGRHDYPPWNQEDDKVRDFVEVLRDQMGYDMGNVDFGRIDARLLRATKAIDESESEHYLRLSQAFQGFNAVKQSSIHALETSVNLAQRVRNDSRQHERYSVAMQAKKTKADAEAKKMEAETRLLSEEADRATTKNASALGYLTREIEATKLRTQLETWRRHPERPMSYLSVDYGSIDRENGEKYLKYLRDNI